jgi:hypothetical protein
MVSIVKYEEPLGLVKVNVFSTPEVKGSPIDPDPYNSRTTTPRAILTAARVGRYDHITPIYIPPYAVPPATLIPGSYHGGVLRLDPTSTPSLK